MKVGRFDYFRGNANLRERHFLRLFSRKKYFLDVKESEGNGYFCHDLTMDVNT